MDIGTYDSEKIYEYGIFRRVSNYPCCSLGLDIANKVYQTVKSKNSLLNNTCNIGEKCVISLYERLTSAFEEPYTKFIVNKVNHVSHVAIDSLENKLPIIKENPLKVATKLKSNAQAVAVPFVTGLSKRLTVILSVAESFVDSVLPKTLCFNSRLNDVVELKQLETLERLHSKLLADSLNEPTVWEQRVAEFRAIRSRILILKERIKYRGLNRVLNSQLGILVRNTIDITRYSSVLFSKYLYYRIKLIRSNFYKQLINFHDYLERQTVFNSIGLASIINSSKPYIITLRNEFDQRYNQLLIFLYNRQLYYQNIYQYGFNIGFCSAVHLKQIQFSVTQRFNLLFQIENLPVRSYLEKKFKSILYHATQHLLLTKLYFSLIFHFLGGVVVRNPKTFSPKTDVHIKKVS